MPKGTLALTDALSSLMASQLSIIQFGEHSAYEQIAEENAAYNRVVRQELSDFTVMSDDTARAYGGAQVIDSEDMTEWDNPDASKASGAYPISFPLTRHGSKTAWTRDWLATNSAEQLAAQYLAMRTGDQQRIQSKIRKALFYPISRPAKNPDGSNNTLAYYERLVAPVNIPLPLYPLLNADGNPVPIGPNGEVFDGTTHTHYMGSDWTVGGSTITTRDGDVQAACNNLLEHRVSGELRLNIHRSNEQQIRALPSFVRNYDTTINVGANLTYANGPLDVLNYNNRLIGTFNGFQVWVKPWMFPNYIMPQALGDTADDALLVWRTRKDGLWSDFDFRSIDDRFPLTAQPMTRDGDCGVWNRHMGVIMYVGAGGTYTAPSVY